MKFCANGLWKYLRNESMDLILFVSIVLPYSGIVNLNFTNDVFLYAEIGLISGCKLVMNENSNSRIQLDPINHGTDPYLQKTTSYLTPISTMGSVMPGSITLLQDINMTTPDPRSSVLNENVTTEFPIGKLSDHLWTILKSMENQSNNKCEFGFFIV